MPSKQAVLTAQDSKGYVGRVNRNSWSLREKPVQPHLVKPIDDAG